MCVSVCACFDPLTHVCVEVSELELWLEEQKAGLESEDGGRSEEAAEALLRKLDGVDVELENQRRIVEKLQEGGASLERLRHPNRWTQPGTCRRGILNFDFSPETFCPSVSATLSQSVSRSSSDASRAWCDSLWIVV